MTDRYEPGPPRRRRWPSLLTNLLLGVVALLAALAVAELLLRLLGISYPVFVWMDPVRGAAHIPGATSVREYEGRPWIEINSDGWRGPEVARAKPPNTFRVALLGDSYIEAFEVPFEKTAGEVLERRLQALRGAPVEVLNFGQGGYGTTQELLTLRHEVWKYDPDFVLLALTTGNDISDNTRALKQTDYVPYFVYRGDSLVLDTSFRAARGYRSRALWTRQLLGVVQHSRLAQLVNRVRHVRRKEERQEERNAATPGKELGMRDEVHLPPTTPEWQEAWKVTEGVLRLMHQECRSRGTPFGIVTLTRGIQVTPDTAKQREFMRQLGADDLYYAERRLADFGRREGIPVLNLAPVMAPLAVERSVYYHAYHDSLGIGHWSEAGNRVAGELMADWLAARLPEAAPSAP